MKDIINIINGIHPGIYIERTLRKFVRLKEVFARDLEISLASMELLCRGARDLNELEAARIEMMLGFEHGLLMKLQTYYRAEMERKSSMAKPDHAIFRPALFWDTNIELIDWEKQKYAVITRVFERGTINEKKAILEFYGRELVNSSLANSKQAQTCFKTD